MIRLYAVKFIGLASSTLKIICIVCEQSQRGVTNAKNEQGQG